ncbi:DNA-formamidopyrimidine glycosylase family protein [Nannocystaceae bacterium ST9]
MPEGDTIHRTANTLRRVLGERILVTCESDSAAIVEWRLVGRRVARVEARGKHLLIHCDPLPDAQAEPGTLAVTIHSHMGMTGAWHVYRIGEPWQQPRSRARLVLGTRDWVVPCFAPELLEPLGPRGLLRHPMLRELGPDLLDPDADLDEAIARLRALGELELGDAILRQSAVAGIGNVYKSELLFLERLDPFARVDELAPERLRALLDHARELLRFNTERRGGRKTRFEGRGGTWVYERSGRACRECGAVIRMRRQGPLARSTYWCPRCQA